MESKHLDFNTDFLGSDLNVDDIIFKLSFGCPLKRDKQCPLKEIRDIRKLPVHKRYFHIMGLNLSYKFKLLSKHYTCYNKLVNSKESIY